MRKFFLFLLLGVIRLIGSNDLPFSPIKNLTNPNQEAVREKMLEAVDDSWKSFQIINEKPFDFPQGDQPIFLKHSLEIIYIEKIQFKNSPLNNIIQYFIELAELNGIKLNIFTLGAHDELKLTFHARGVNFWRALELLSVVAGFQMDEDEGVIFFSKSSETSRENFVHDVLQISRGAVAEIIGDIQQTILNKNTHNNLSRLEEETILKAFFKRSGIDFDVPGAYFAFDGTRLIVTHTFRQMKRLKSLLKNYQKSAQVEIEAKFMEIQQGALEELGVRWKLGHGNDNIQTLNPLTGASSLRTLQQAFGSNGISGGNGSVVMDGKTIASVPNIPPNLPGGLNLAGLAPNLLQIKGLISGWNIDVVAKALQQEGGADLMSAPKLTVLSGKTAEIVVAKELRYPQSYSKIDSAVGVSGSTLVAGSSAGVTITAGTPQDFTMRRIGVEMKVTPIVEQSGQRIFLRLEPQVTELDGFVEYGGQSVAISGGATVNVPSGFFQPTFSVRKISTEVITDNDSVLVLGGLTRDEKVKVVDKVPLLGDIPILGNLFRSKGESIQKKSLVTLLTARAL